MENLLSLGDYEGMTYNDIVIDIVGNYEVEQSIVDSYKIVVASTEYASYEGSSYFLLIHRSTGKLYEVHGGHCSCYGFEGQFQPEETTVEYIFSNMYPYRDCQEIMLYLTKCLCFFFRKKKLLKLKEKADMQ